MSQEEKVLVQILAQLAAMQVVLRRIMETLQRMAGPDLRDP